MAGASGLRRLAFWASACDPSPMALAGGDPIRALIHALGNLGGFVGPSLGGYH